MEDEKDENEGGLEKKKLKILIYPIHGEVIPQRLWYALTADDSPARDLYEISGFAGRHPMHSRNGEEGIIERLEREIIERGEIIKESRGTDREGNIPGIEKEIRSLNEFISLISNGTISYYQLNETNSTVPEEAYENCDCVFIGTNNLTHPFYVDDAINRDIDFICEKPYAVKRRDIRKVQGLEEKIHKKGLIGKITCHFAHKPAFLEFVDNLKQLIRKEKWEDKNREKHEGYGKITRFEGHYEEFDDPDNPRTRATLDPNKSGGGIYLDTGCHFYSMLFQLGANLESMVDGTESFEWDCFGDYTTDTFARVKHKNVCTDDKYKEVRGDNFFNAEVEITVSKFAHKYKHNPKDENAEPLKDEYKELILTFENGYRAHVLFPKGKVEIRDENGNEVRVIYADPKYSKNEYANILVNFYNRKMNGNPPYTLTDVGIDACEAIIDTYYDLKSDRSRIKLYAQPI